MAASKDGEVTTGGDLEYGAVPKSKSTKRAVTPGAQPRISPESDPEAQPVIGSYESLRDTKEVHVSFGKPKPSLLKPFAIGTAGLVVAGFGAVCEKWDPLKNEVPTWTPVASYSVGGFFAVAGYAVLAKNAWARWCGSGYSIEVRDNVETAAYKEESKVSKTVFDRVSNFFGGSKDPAAMALKDASFTAGEGSDNDAKAKKKALQSQGFDALKIRPAPPTEEVIEDRDRGNDNSPKA